jgi:hypothetical protein
MRREMFETPGHVTVQIKGRAGEIHLTTHDRPTTEVEMTGGDDLIEAIRIDHSLRDHRVVINVAKSGSGRASGLLGLRPGDSDPVTLSVRLPVASDIDVSTSSATITGDGRYGQAGFRTASGDITVERVDGDLRTDTASGNVRIGSVGGGARIETASGNVRSGPLKGPNTIATASGDVVVDAVHEHLSVKTASGDVTVGGLHEGCRIHTVSGDQRVHRIVAGEVRLDTTTGDLTVEIVPGASVKVDVQTVTGHLRSEIDLDDDGPSTDAGPRVDLRARTVSGDVALLRSEGT